jgi:hypothetical protein
MHLCDLVSRTSSNSLIIFQQLSVLSIVKEELNILEPNNIKIINNAISDSSIVRADSV